MSQHQIISFLLLTGISQGVTLAIVLLTSKRHRKLSNVMLAVFLLSYSFKLLLNTPYSPSIGLGNYLVSILLLGPSFFLYIRSVVNPKFVLRKVHLLHIVPALVFLVLISAFTSTYQITSYEQIFNTPSLLLITSIFQTVAAIQAMTYVVCSALEMKRYQAWTFNHHSNLKTINLNWLRWLTYSFLAVTIIWWIAGYADIAYLILWFGEPSIQVAYFFWALMSLVVLVIGYYGLFRPELFIDREPESISNSTKRLSETELNLYTQRLLELMEREKPYLNPKLKLSDLATKMSVNTGILSLIINQGTGKNFNDFVNEYRVTEFKARLKSGDHQNFTLLAIALDSGFNSKSSFNAIFKKITGNTPNQFRNQLS
ncbi:MAG: AraC family transcriptional regulator [Roseivirga sp.]|nr:AraC family transcriptional regulator [Roseivirga sp.]